MRTFRDAKLMARSLRETLRARQIEISQSDGLEIVARLFGFDNWNILASRIPGNEGQSQTSPQFHMGIPILRILSVEKATEFYCDFLGFALDWKQG